MHYQRDEFTDIAQNRNSVISLPERSSVWQDLQSRASYHRHEPLGVNKRQVPRNDAENKSERSAGGWSAAVHLPSGIWA